MKQKIKQLPEMAYFTLKTGLRHVIIYGASNVSADGADLYVSTPLEVNNRVSLWYSDTDISINVPGDIIHCDWDARRLKYCAKIQFKIDPSDAQGMDKVSLYFMALRMHLDPFDSTCLD